ncbi:MAG: NTP transferase domain-containing protein [Prevotella sp.]|nr:NTP transferase domain-containing protein [Prevotella sp.]
MQAMIFAAGLGTRLKPLTDTMPKALVRVGESALLERVIRKLAAAGAGRMVVNVHHFAEQVKEFLCDNNNFGQDIAVSDESSQLLDTGGGMKKAQSLFNDDEPILIHNVDILSNVDLKEFYEQGRQNDATLLVSNRQTTRYLLFDDDMRLVGWTNIKTGEVRSPYDDLNPNDCTMMAFAGIHSFSPRLFPLMDCFPDKFGIMDFYLNVCHKTTIKGIVAENLKLLDVGKTESLADAERFLKEMEQ